MRSRCLFLAKNRAPARVGCQVRRWSGVVLAFAAATAAFGQPAIDGLSLSVVKERAEMLHGMLAKDPVELVAKIRRICVSGQAPATTAKSRSLGVDTQPDASDLCPTALVRIARDGDLMAPYRDMLVELTGGSAGYERLPGAIAVTAMKPGSNQVPIGGQRAAIVTAALAFDAGFTVAYQKGERLAAGSPTPAALKPVVERCLGQSERDLGLCYSAGYVFGTRAFNRVPMTAQ